MDSSAETTRLACVRSVLNTVASLGTDSCLEYILKNLSKEQQERFGTTLLRKIIEPGNTQFCVSGDEVQKLLGFACKKTFVKHLKKNLRRDDHYTKSGSKASSSTGAGRPSDDYLLTIDAVRKLSMSADTEEGEKAKDYYLRMEDLVMAYGAEQLRASQERFRVSDEQRRASDEKNVLLEAEVKRLSGCHKIDVEPGDAIYAFVSGNFVKVGRSKNLKGRTQQHATSNPFGEMDYRLDCLDSKIVERASHHILNEYQFQNKGEWFKVDKETALEVMTTCQLFLDGLVGRASGLVAFSMSEHVKTFLREYYRFYDEGGFTTRQQTAITKSIVTCELPGDKAMMSGKPEKSLQEENPPQEGPVEALSETGTTSGVVQKTERTGGETLPLVTFRINQERLAKDVATFQDNFVVPMNDGTLLAAEVYNILSILGVSLQLEDTFGKPVPEYDTFLGGEKSVFLGWELKEVHFRPDLTENCARFLAQRGYVIHHNGWTPATLLESVSPYLGECVWRVSKESDRKSFDKQWKGLQVQTKTDPADLIFLITDEDTSNFEPEDAVALMIAMKESRRTAFYHWCKLWLNCWDVWYSLKSERWIMGSFELRYWKVESLLSEMIALLLLESGSEDKVALANLVETWLDTKTLPRGLLVACASERRDTELFPDVSDTFLGPE